MKTKYQLLLGLLAFNIMEYHPAAAHGNTKHDADGFEIISAGPPQALIGQLALSYESQVAPIFKRKCYDCHGKSQDKPWYYILPGIKQLIDYDIHEAQEHMNMTNGFPFQGHGSPKDDLIALRKTIKQGSMPPFLYLFMHPDNMITQVEQKTILEWIAKTLEQFD